METASQKNGNLEGDPEIRSLRDERVEHLFSLNAGWGGNLPADSLVELLEEFGN